jgi:hypothetical protein
MATFNLLGSSHTANGGHSPGMASGVARMPGALQILAQHQVTVAGLQEFQPDQRAAFQRQATGWAMYPGLSMGRKAGENSVAWRTDTWDLVKTGLVNITYFNGRERPMPYVLLKNKATGGQAYFSTFHNPANIGGNMQRWRAEATSREIKLFNELEATGVPQLVTGDMNERAEYFCRVTAGTRLVAAAGGSNAGTCRPPKPIGSPDESKIGKRMRARKKSLVPPRLVSTARPASRSTFGGNFSARTSWLQSSGAQPMRYLRTASPSSPRSRR